MMMRSKCKSAMMLVLGVLFLLGTMNVWAEFTFVKYWPLFLILLGAHGLFCSCEGGSCAKGADGKPMMGGKEGGCCGKGGNDKC